MFFNTIDSCLDSNHLSCEKKLNHAPNASGYLVWQAGRQNTDGFQNFKSLLQAKLFEFYLIHCQCNLIIVFSVGFLK